MYPACKNGNIGIMMGSETDEIIEELFKSVLQRYQEGLEKSLNDSDLIYFKWLSPLYFFRFIT